MSLLPGVPDDATVFKRFERAAGRFPERPLLAVLPETAAAYGIPSGEVTYREALTRVESLAAAYRAAGYEIGRAHV